MTAQKRTQSLSDVGQTVNVVGTEQLARQGVTNVADLTKSVSGLTVATNYDGTPIYTLRGVSFNSVYFGTSPTVNVYVDEAPLPFPLMTEGALLDLERVEVLKGPQGTLFGQNATGGAINYIAAKPTDQFQAGIKATYSRFDTFQGEGYISGPLAGNLNARLAVGGTRSGPWQRSATRDDELGEQRKLAGRLLLDWRPTDRLKVAINLNGWLDKSDTQAPQLVLPLPGNPLQAHPGLASSPVTATAARNADWWANEKFRRDISFYQAVLRADYEIGDNAVLTSLTDFTRVDIDSFSNFDGNAIRIQSTLNEGYVQAISQELRVSGDLANDSLHYLVGGFLQDDKSLEIDHLYMDNNSVTHNIAADPASGFPGFGSFERIDLAGKQKNRAYALFANLDWNATDQLTLSGGFRQTWITHKSRGCSRDAGDGDAAAVYDILSSLARGAAGLRPAAPIPPGGCVTLGPDFASYEQDESFKEKNFSWRLNANYKANSDVLFYATVSRGYKGGNYPVLAASSYTQLAPVRQEELTAYEAGTKLRLFDRRLAINAAVFYYDYKDKQLNTNYLDPLFEVLFRLSNVPKSKVKGFDIDATLVPTEGLTLRSAVTYADSRIGAYSGFNEFGNAIDLTGSSFNLAPKWTLVSDAEYEHDITGDLKGFVGATYTYNSKTYGDLGNSPLFLIRSFGTLDLRAGISSSKGWELMGFIRNATNAYTWNYAISGGDSILRFANMPRTYGITASYKY